MTTEHRLFTFSTICPHLSCSVQLPLYLYLFYKLTSNKTSSKFSPNTKFWIGDPALSRTKWKIRLRCLPCKLRFKVISLSQVIDSFLARGTEHGFVQSTDSTFPGSSSCSHLSFLYNTHEIQPLTEQSLFTKSPFKLCWSPLGSPPW